MILSLSSPNILYDGAPVNLKLKIYLLHRRIELLPMDDFETVLI